jgi:seryl-tRNA synthetase
MLDLKLLLNNTENAVNRLRLREPDFDMSELETLDSERRSIIGKVEGKKAEQNRASREIGARKKAGESADEILDVMKGLSEEIKALDTALEQVEKSIRDIVEQLPNIPDEATPVAPDKSGNVIHRTSGVPRDPEDWDFEFHNHMEVAAGLGSEGGLDFTRASRMTGSNWPCYRGRLACLEWALVSYFIDRAVESGRELIIPPYLVNSESMFSSGQFPKFREQAYECSDDDLVLIPTSEVPLLNLYRGEMLPGDSLPLRLASFTPCFRREAGTYGTEERGLIRMHQFHKVEIFSYTHPDQSRDELESMKDYAEQIVESLGVPFQTTILATGDLAQQAAFTYDIEAWLPGQKAFSEVSSVSNCTDYQARRANIRFRPSGEKKAKPEFVHTLNGSALATSRIMVSILEHYQEPDGGLKVPDVLKPYMKGLERIDPVPR